MALHTGAMPLFFNDPFWEPLKPCPDLLHVAKDAHISTPDFTLQRLRDFDSESAEAWETMWNFCRLMNLASTAERRLPPEIHLNTMAAVMYRLFFSTYRRGSAEEAFRLGVLAFCSHVFLRWQNVRLPYNHLSTSYKDCLATLISTDHIAPPTLLWLLAIGKLAISSESDGEWWNCQLGSCIKHCGLVSWTGMRDILKSFLWINVLHDIPGKEVFETARSTPHIN